jgi:hypothetical protein
MPEQVRYRSKVTQSGIFLVRYRTKIRDNGMPMPALVSSMPMLSYGEQVHLYTEVLYRTEHTADCICTYEYIHICLRMNIILLKFLLKKEIVQ